MPATSVPAVLDPVLAGARQRQRDEHAAYRMAVRSCELLTRFANGIAGVGDSNPSAQKQHYAEAVELAAQVLAILGPRPSTSADVAHAAGLAGACAECLKPHLSEGEFCSSVCRTNNARRNRGAA